ncbi:MAG TPA: endopeptidase La [Candidatus Paceibacterota bacterium]
MEPNQEIFSPNEHILVNVVPTGMIMPGMGSYRIIEENESSQRILQAARNGLCQSFFIVMSDPRIDEIPDRFYRTGVIVKVEADPKDPIVNLRGMFRAERLRLRRVKGPGWEFLVVTVKKVEDENYDDYFTENHQQIMANVIKIRDLLVGFMTQARGFYNFDNRLMLRIVDGFENTDWGNKDEVDNFVWAVLSSVPDLLQNDTQPFLENTNLPERVGLCVKTLKKRLRLLEIQKRVSLTDNNQLRSIKNVPIVNPKEQVKDEDEFVKGVHGDIKKRWEKFKEVRDYMSEDARDVVLEDIGSLKSFESPQKNTYEWPKVIKRLDFVLGLPWKEETAEESNIAKVAEILDEDHYGLQHVKDRICESIAPKILNPEGKGHIICFIGPPGVGKTSLAKSIARALNKKLTRMSVGGIRDEAQIRGHSFTYVGSGPGEVLKLVKRCGVRNPVFVIDEIDKLGNMSVSGDPSSAMLEVFDPEQNNSFKDHYVSCGFDLSRVMFIATANVEENIIPPLRDRMDIISLPGYLEVEKIEIAKRYLVPRWLKETGLSQNNVQIEWEDGIIAKLIRGYTSEAGVRNLERTIASILRKISREYLKSRSEEKPLVQFMVTQERVHEYLGPFKFFKDRARPTLMGEAIGLAWTPVGGDILYVQVETYPRLQDKKVFARTGMQGDVMKESDEVALTVMRNRHPELSEMLSKVAIHLHIPDGAVPKDGPSAGITIETALESRVTNRTVKPNLAMTGEMDLKERVLPVGGIREKIVAAERAGIKEIIMPKENERDLYDVPKDVKDKLKFHFVENIDQVLEVTFQNPA